MEADLTSTRCCIKALDFATVMLVSEDRVANATVSWIQIGPLLSFRAPPVLNPFLGFALQALRADGQGVHGRAGNLVRLAGFLVVDWAKMGASASLATAGPPGTGRVRYHDHRHTPKSGA